MSVGMRRLTFSPPAVSISSLNLDRALPLLNPHSFPIIVRKILHLLQRQTGLPCRLVSLRAWLFGLRRGSHLYGSDSWPSHCWIRVGWYLYGSSGHHCSHRTSCQAAHLLWTDRRHVRNCLCCWTSCKILQCRCDAFNADISNRSVELSQIKSLGDGVSTSTVRNLDSSLAVTDQNSAPGSRHGRRSIDLFEI